MEIPAVVVVGVEFILEMKSPIEPLVDIKWLITAATCFIF